MKAIVISKKHIFALSSVILILTLCIIFACGAFADNKRKLPIYCVDTDSKKIAVSFDAAWGNDDTQTLINILDEYKVPATFFVVGAWVDKYPESVKQLSNAGHKVMNHSNTHPYMSKLSASQMADEINTCNNKIKKITGVAPNLFRAPYGDYNNLLIDTLGSLSMNCIQWSVDSLDWKESSTPESIKKRVLSKIKNGSIVLFHNDAEYTPEALPEILKTLKDEGYEFVFIEDLIMKENYYIDNTGKQCRNKE